MDASCSALDITVFKRKRAEKEKGSSLVLRKALWHHLWTAVASL
jgi:hypothetical protein